MLAEHNSWFNSANIYCISSSLLLPHLVLIPDPSTILFVSLCDGSKTKTVETKPSSLLLQAELVSCLHPAAPALHAEHTWTYMNRLHQKSQPTWHWMASELHIHAISSIPYRPIRCRGMKYWYLLMTFISDSCNMLSSASTSPTTSCHHSPRCSRKTECQP